MKPMEKRSGCRRWVRLILCVVVAAAALVGAFFAGRATAEPEVVYTGGKTFYATIEEIREVVGSEMEGTAILVQGLEINDINHRGRFCGIIEEDTKLTWRATDMTVDELKLGQTVAITYTGGKTMSSPNMLMKVVVIELLDDVK